ncbi:MAG: antitoxin of toxin-antitoxin stability system [Thiopseudomonas sp.]
MGKAVFTMKLDQDLRDDFMQAALEEDRPASQLVRDLMRSYLAQRRTKLEYEDYYQQKVATARKSMRAGLGCPNEEVEAMFAAKREQARAARS